MCEGAPVTPRAAAVSLRPCPPPWKCPGCPEAQGSLLTWMFSSTFFHWQNRVNLSLQRSTERARVEALERPPSRPISGQKDPLDLSGDRQHPPGNPVWEKRDPRSDLGMRRPRLESLVWVQTPLELLRRDPWPLSGLEEPGPQWDGTP